MAKKKATKKVAAKPMPMKTTCGASGNYCTPVLALLIIVLAWWKPAVMWSQIVITVAAAIIFLSRNNSRR